MSREVFKSPLDEGFRYTGSFSGTSPLLDLGAVLLVSSLVGLMTGIMFNWMMDAEKVGKNQDEKDEIDKIKVRISTINNTSTLLMIIGVIMFLYSKLSQ